MAEKSTRNCFNCGIQVNIEDAFCNNCGASLTETIELDSSIPIKRPYSQLPISPQIPSKKPYVKTKIGTGRVSLAIGILAFIISNIFVINFIALILAALAILFGFVNLKQKEEKPGFAIGGLILGVLAIAAYVVSYFYQWWYLIF